ncbi:sugar ABC transporter permease, partial [Lachnotalea glycerini]
MVKKKKSFRWKNALPVYALMLPGILYFLINNYLPMFGMIIAFKKLNFRDGILKSPWCGLDNFKFLFSQGNTALIMTRNTILYNIVFII